MIQQEGMEILVTTFRHNKEDAFAESSHQEKILLIPVHSHRQVEGSGVQASGAAVQIQEGCGVEHAVQLQTYNRFMTRRFSSSCSLIL